VSCLKLKILELWKGCWIAYTFTFVFLQNSGT
jgi:hypothetical protein